MGLEHPAIEKLLFAAEYDVVVVRETIHGIDGSFDVEQLCQEAIDMPGHGNQKFGVSVRRGSGVVESLCQFRIDFRQIFPERLVQSHEPTDTIQVSEAKRRHT
jgi:hypothetical protein